MTIQELTSLPGVNGRTLDMTLTLRPESAASRFTLFLARDDDHKVAIQYDPAREELLLDRTGDGSTQDIAHMRRVHTGLKNGQLTLRALLDKESLELFINGGEKLMTVQLFSPPEADGIAFSASEPCNLSVEAHHLG